ncbi:MAG: DUF3783 domain-containing protein [Clostridia bacterium]|nr:DUF3783 domain-containing protein [Clostridia bacterium]
MKATVLYYHLAKEKEDAIVEAVSLLGAIARRVEDTEVGMTVGYLAGDDDAPTMEGENLPKAIEAEVLVMCGFTQLQFNLLMAMFQKKKIPQVQLKAMLTPTNRDWTFAKLVGELKVEHTLMTAQKKSKKN